MNIIQAIRDENLFRPFLGNDLSSWFPWMAALRTVYGLDVIKPASRALVRECTGRDPDLMPEDGFSVALFLTGRRSGKSRIAAVAGAFEAVLGGHESKLAKGERGLVPIIAPTKAQASIIGGYLRSIFDTPLLRNEVVAETRDGFDLKNGISVEVLAGDWRTVRGYTLVAAILDEAAFLGLSEESKVRSDTELIRAIRPGLATTRGRLYVVSSPYARKGWCWIQYQKNFGNDVGKVLVWNSPSRSMNPTLSQAFVDEQLAEDLQSAKAEYLGEFRDDLVEAFPRSVIEAAVVEGRLEISPEHEVEYFAFADVSGGRGDDSALSIAHCEERKVILDFIKRYRPPHSPADAISDMADELKRYGVQSIVGDNYAGEFVASAFRSNGINYRKSEKTKGTLYLDFLPRLCSGQVELLDDKISVAQLAALERRTRSGGKDIIDHPRGTHDDVANVIAGVCDVAGARRMRVGIL